MMRTRNVALVAFGAVLVAGVVVGSVLVFGNDGNESARTDKEPTTVRDAPTTTTAAPVDDRIWPDPTSSRRFTVPSNVVHFFAVEALGFREPLLSELTPEGVDAGQIAVRSSTTGPPSVVSVARLRADSTWWVTGASAAVIQLDQPSRGELVVTPVDVSGRASAFEGTIDVEVRDARGMTLGQGFVTGSGGATLGPFAGTVAFTVPNTRDGLLVLRSQSPGDGRTVAATVRKVRFG